MRMISLTKHRTAFTAVSIKKMVITAIMAAMITILTAYIFHIPVGVNGGYVHLGDAVIYLAAAILPLPYACAAAAIGGGMADLMTAPVWVPATIIIKTLICIPFSSKETKIITKRNIAALIFSGVITIAGYYIAEGILYGFTAALWVMIAGNVVQAAGSGVIFFVFGTALDKVRFKTRVMNLL